MAVGCEVVGATRTERLQGAENSARTSVMSGIVSRLRGERESHASPGPQGTLGNARASGEATRSARMKKLKNESALFKAALFAAIEYAEKRGAVEFEPGDSASEKLLYVYRLLVHDKLIQPLPESQVSEAALRHKLAIWHARQLPADHPLLKA